MAEHRIFSLAFAELYPLYLAKVERKGRTREELDRVLTWLTGYDDAGLAACVEDGRDLRTFFDRAPRMNPRTDLITGLVCGVRVEEVADPLLQQIRWMDKLVDELARGKTLASVLRG